MVSLNTESTQAELLDAVATLKAAVEKFKTQAIPAHDLTELNALIKEAEDFIAANGNGDFILSTALAAAKEVAGTPDNYTASEVEETTSDLKKALKAAKDNAGIDEMGEEGLTVTTPESMVRVSGLSAGESVEIYTLDGKLVFSEKATESLVEANTGAGRFAVVISGNTKKLSKVVIVK